MAASCQSFDFASTAPFFTARLPLAASCSRAPSTCICIAIWPLTASLSSSGYWRLKVSRRKNSKKPAGDKLSLRACRRSCGVPVTCSTLPVRFTRPTLARVRSQRRHCRRSLARKYSASSSNAGFWLLRSPKNFPHNSSPAVKLSLATSAVASLSAWAVNSTLPSTAKPSPTLLLSAEANCPPVNLTCAVINPGFFGS